MNYSDYARATLGKDETSRAPNDNELRSLLPEVQAPCSIVPKLFLFQSYFDSTLLGKAILEQNPNEAIVKSTLGQSQASGYALGLHPSSQTPVAVQFMQGGMPGSGTYILKPGQIIRPFGKPNSSKATQFAGFLYGLPMGWLGGGLAQLVVFHTPDANVDWNASAEVIFHRTRIAVKQPSDLTAAGSFNNAPKNWPMRFPWPQALRGSSSILQKSNPVVGIVEPTKVAMVLRQSSPPLAATGTMRMLFQSTNDFGLDSSGAVITTEPAFVDITWAGWANVGTSGNLSTQAPVKIFTGTDPVVRLAADDGGVLFVDMLTGGGTPFSGSFVDVVRYGKL